MHTRMNYLDLHTVLSQEKSAQFEKLAIQVLRLKSKLRFDGFDIGKIRRVQNWKAAHLPTLEIRVEQKGNQVKKDKEKKEEKINAAPTGNRNWDPSITD